MIILFDGLGMRGEVMGTKWIYFNVTAISVARNPFETFLWFKNSSTTDATDIYAVRDAIHRCK